MPFKPRHWLKLQPAGVKEGDLVFVAGYPGRTQRLATYGEVKEAVEWTFPRTIRTFQEQIDLLDALGKQDPALKIKAASRVAGLNNTLTNRKGMLEGLVRGGLLSEKQAREERLAAWIAADPARQKELGDVLPALAATLAEASKTRERDAVLAQLYGASTLLGSARTARLVALERAKKLDVDRELGYQERDFPGSARPSSVPSARSTRASTRRCSATGCATPPGSGPGSASASSTSSPASRRGWRRPTATRRSTPTSTG